MNDDDDLHAHIEGNKVDGYAVHLYEGNYQLRTMESSPGRAVRFYWLPRARYVGRRMVKRERLRRTTRVTERVDIDP